MAVVAWAGAAGTAAAASSGAAAHVVVAVAVSLLPGAPQLPLIVSFSWRARYIRNVPDHPSSSSAFRPPVLPFCSSDQNIIASPFRRRRAYTGRYRCPSFPTVVARHSFRDFDLSVSFAPFLSSYDSPPPPPPPPPPTFQHLVEIEPRTFFDAPAFRSSFGPSVVLFHLRPSGSRPTVVHSLWPVSESFIRSGACDSIHLAPSNLRVLVAALCDTPPRI